MYPVGGGARVSVFRTRPKRSYASGGASHQQPIRAQGKAISGGAQLCGERGNRTCTSDHF